MANTPGADNAKLTRSLIITLLIAAVIFILRQLWEVFSLFTELILLFGVAWLVSFMVNPLRNYLNRHPVPPQVIRELRRRGQVKLADRLDSFRLPHTLSVVIIYLLLLFLIALFATYAIPSLIIQLITLGQSLPRLIQLIPHALTSIQEQLANLGIVVDISSLYQPAQLVQRAENIGAQIIQSAFTLATSVASALISILMVLALSLYMTLDAPRLARQLHAIIPDHYHGRLNLVGQSISRTFGGFIRGQILIAFLYGIPAAILMASAGIGLAIVIGTISGLLMLVPLIGAPIAMVLPALIAWMLSPGDALWLLIVMTIYQQLLLHLFAPKVMADVIGMPPLFVLLSMMASMRLIGFWGLVFGIPLAGVLYALTFAYLEQAKIRREAMPRADKESVNASSFHITGMGPGCLLVADIQASKDSMRPLATYLAGQGLTTIGLYPYTGKENETWEDWYATVMVALDQLWRECNHVCIIGEGIGATLALHAASELPLAAVATLSLPITRDGYYHQQNLLHSSLPNDPNEDTSMQVILTPHVCTSIAHLQERVHSELPEIRTPTLLIQPKEHAVTEPEDARYVLSRLGTHNKRIEWMATNGFGSNQIRQQAAQVCFSFFRNHGK